MQPKKDVSALPGGSYSLSGNTYVEWQILILQSQMRVMEICPICGSWIDAGEPYCPECGYVSGGSSQTVTVLN